MSATEQLLVFRCVLSVLLRLPVNAADGGTLDTDRSLVRGFCMVTAGSREVLDGEPGSALTTSLRSKAARFSSQNFWCSCIPNVDSALDARVRIWHTVIFSYHFVLHSRPQLIGTSSPRVALQCHIELMSGGSSSDWWDGWEWRGEWGNTTSPPDPQPLEQAPNETAIASIHRLQDQLQQTLTNTQRRSHKTESERMTSRSKGNAAFTAIREWQIEAKRAYDQKFAEAELQRRSITTPSDVPSRRPKRLKGTSRLSRCARIRLRTTSRVYTVVTGYTATGTSLPVAFYHPETSTASAGGSRSGSRVTGMASRLSNAAISQSHGAARVSVFLTWTILSV